MFRHLTLATTLAVACIAGAAHASPVVESASLESTQLDPNLGFRSTGAIANVEIDYASQSIGLLVEDKPLPCESSVPRCMPPVHVAKSFVAPIVERRDSCGSKIYVARLVSTVPGGSSFEIEVQDHRWRMCTDLQPGTRLKLSTWNASARTRTSSVFEGAPLAATSLPTRPESVELDEMSLDPNLSLANKTVSASLSVDQGAGKASLTFKIDPCKNVGRPCRGMIYPRTVELPITSVSTDACGSTVIVAQTRPIALGGPVETLSIVDHRTRLCEDLIRKMTEVAFDTSSGSGVVHTTHSEFAGDALN